MSAPKTCPHCGNTYAGSFHICPNKWEYWRYGLKPTTEPQREWYIEKRIRYSATERITHYFVGGPDTVDPIHDALMRVHVVEASRLEQAVHQHAPCQGRLEKVLKLLDAAERERDEAWAEINRRSRELCEFRDACLNNKSELAAANARIDELSVKLHAANMDFRRYSLSEVDTQLSAANLRIAELESILSGKTFDDQADAWRSAAMKLRESLGFYGSRKAWSVADCSSEDEPGDIARKALAEFDAFVTKQKE